MDNAWARSQIQNPPFTGTPVTSGYHSVTGSYTTGTANTTSRERQETSKFDFDKAKTVEYNGFKIKYEDNNGQVSFYLDLFREIVDKYKLNIVVVNPHGMLNVKTPYARELKDLVKNDTLYIANFSQSVCKVWSSQMLADVERGKYMKEIDPTIIHDSREIVVKVNDKKMILENFQGDSWVYDTDMDEAFIVFDELEQNRLATVHANKIFIGFDLMHSSSDQSKEIFRYIIERGMTIIEEHSEELFGDFSEDSYVQYCNKAYLKALNDKRKEVKEINWVISQQEKNIFEHERKKLNILNELKNMNEESVKNAKKEEYSEITKLVELGMYKEFKIRDGKLLGYTTEITINYEGRNYKMGEFEVSISGESGFLNITNLTNQRKGYNHPHVNREGGCCLGNVRADIHKMIGAEQYLLAFQMLYQFLASYDSHNPYTAIDLWDVEWDGETVISAETTIEELDRNLETIEDETMEPTPVSGANTQGWTAEVNSLRGTGLNGMDASVTPTTSLPLYDNVPTSRPSTEDLVGSSFSDYHSMLALVDGLPIRAVLSALDELNARENRGVNMALHLALMNRAQDLFNARGSVFTRQELEGLDRVGVVGARAILIMNRAEDNAREATREAQSNPQVRMTEF